MEFSIGDRIRVAKSAVADYVGLEGVVVRRRPDSDPIFNSYTLKTDEGQLYDFLEFQVELVRPSGSPKGAA
jgi:hypothetical protein